jgi:hypothetical protein
MLAAFRRKGRMPSVLSPSGGSAASTKLLTPWPCSDAGSYYVGITMNMNGGDCMV